MNRMISHPKDHFIGCWNKERQNLESKRNQMKAYVVISHLQLYHSVILLPYFIIEIVLCFFHFVNYFWPRIFVDVNDPEFPTRSSWSRTPKDERVWAVWDMRIYWFEWTVQIGNTVESKFVDPYHILNFRTCITID